MTTAAAKKVKAKRARRPIYLLVDRLMDPDTGEMIGCLRPANAIDQRLLKERKFRIGREVRAELKQPREVWKHKLIHKIGGLLVDHVDEFAACDSHEAIKRVQRKAGVCVEEREIPGTDLVIREAKSLAFDEMEHSEFEQLFEGITQYIGDHYAGVMLDEVRAEFWQMANGEGGR